MNTKNIGIAICLVVGFSLGWLSPKLVRSWLKPADPVVAKAAETYGGLTQDEINEETMRRSAGVVVELMNVPTASSDSTSPAFRMWFGSRDIVIESYVDLFARQGTPLTANQRAVLAREIVPRLEVILAGHWAQNGYQLEHERITEILRPWSDGIVGMVEIAKGRGLDLGQ